MNQPLSGKRIVVTRAHAQASELSERLRALGGEVIEIPAIRIAPPADNYAALDAAIAELASYDWIVFTSINGVEHFWERFEKAGFDAAALKSVRLAAIGSATAQALEALGLVPEIVPKEFVAESLLEALKGEPLGIASQRFLLPRADIARKALHEGLVAAGAEVNEVHAYRTVVGEPDANALAELEQGVDLITFTSSSTVRNFVEQLGSQRIKKLTQEAAIAAIGPITARTVQELGLHVNIIATEYTIPGLVLAIVRDL